jgi:hypothetical protein
MVAVSEGADLAKHHRAIHRCSYYATSAMSQPEDGPGTQHRGAVIKPSSTSTVPLKKQSNFRQMRAAVRLLAPHLSVEASLWPLGQEMLAS